MIILTIRTDKPEAEIGLYENDQQLAYHEWHAHRALAETLHQTILSLLETSQLSLTDLNGIVCYQGPGSFTGLRIGLTVGNTLAYSLGLPIVSSEGEDWRSVGIARLNQGENDRMALPVYDAAAITTAQKK